MARSCLKARALVLLANPRPHCLLFLSCGAVGSERAGGQRRSTGLTGEWGRNTTKRNGIGRVDSETFNCDMSIFSDTCWVSLCSSMGPWLSVTTCAFRREKVSCWRHSATCTHLRLHLHTNADAPGPHTHLRPPMHTQVAPHLQNTPAL